MALHLDSIKPLLSNGVQYLKEVAKCTVAGLLVSGTALLVLISVLPFSSRGLGALAFGGCVLFMVVYGVVGHQRGIFRMLSNLAHAHGGLLFDQTLGRFVDMTEQRRPGTVASMLSAPGKIAAGFKAFMRDDASAIPRPLRRLGGYYADKFDARVTQGGSLPVGAVVEGQLRQDLLKEWAVQQMREQFEPSWAPFALVAALQIGLATGLWWSAR